MFGAMADGVSKKERNQDSSGVFGWSPQEDGDAVVVMGRLPVESCGGAQSSF